jgi:hypothetical protein
LKLEEEMWKWERAKTRCYEQKGTDRQIDETLMVTEQMLVDLIDRDEQRQQRNNMRNRGKKM